MGLLHENKNFCKKGMMSTCTAKDKEEQKSCTFYEKARFLDNVCTLSLMNIVIV